MLKIANAALAALLIAAASASAEPFTGRYIIEAMPGLPGNAASAGGGTLNGYIEFVGATTTLGTTYLGYSGFAFRLADSSAFRLVVSGPLITPTVYDSLSQTRTDDLIVFDSQLGASELRPIGGLLPMLHGHWSGLGDLDGEMDAIDEVLLAADPINSRWEGVQDFGLRIHGAVGERVNYPGYAWKLVLEPNSVPEPGDLTLIAATVCSLAWFRRRH